MYEHNLDFATRKDREDPLNKYRSEFLIPTNNKGEELIYLCGNSLGLQPKKTCDYIQQELNDWAKFGVEGHTDAKNPWLPYHEFLTNSMAKIVGAKPSEVVIMNSLTTNLHLMMVSFYQPSEKKYKILIESDAFPSDKYAMESQLKFHGYDIKDALIETAKLAVMIFTIIWGVLIYVRFLGFADLPSAFSDWITSLDQSPMLTLIFILLAYAILGMFMDAIGMLLLTLPITYPAVMALNGGEYVSAADSAFGMSGPMAGIWFGILVVKMAEFCLITPPIGLNCFVVAGVRDDLSVQDVFKGVTPFFIADAFTIAGLIAFPSIVLWLPSLAS